MSEALSRFAITPITPIVLLAGMFVPVSGAQGPRYTLASLQGDYGVVTHYNGNLAQGVGTEYFDGNGKCHASLILNRPTATGTRELVPLTLTGTYTVNNDGTGIFSVQVTLPDGSIKTATLDFVITRSQVMRGVPVALQIADEQREPSLVLGNGVFVTQDFTRREEDD
jgi:hypothetical protein